ncbi:MAG: hypothetical protein AB7N65_14160, partial [Vicinamibacterales bacterium]
MTKQPRIGRFGALVAGAVLLLHAAVGAAPTVTEVTAPGAPVKLGQMKLLNTDASPMVLLYGATNVS